MQKTWTKRSITWIVVILTATTFFVGCGGGETKQETPKADTPVVAPAPAPVAPDTMPKVDSTTAPKVDGRKTNP